MNKFAEVIYGKVLQVYEDERDFETWKKIFSPLTFWVDVTGLECEKGYLVSFDENTGLVLKSPEVVDGDTQAEKLAYLDYTYSANKQELAIAYVDAMMSEDTDSQASLKTDLETLNAEYDKARAELEAE